VSDAVLESGWTDTNKRVLYSTYDVTHLLSTTTPNVLGACLVLRPDTGTQTDTEVDVCVREREEVFIRF
jgi:hypothetical protein